jgi:dephospho-CoA kinase
MAQFLLGITGAVGAGKSTLARQFQALGWPTLDLDDVIAAQLRAKAVQVLRLVPSARAADGQLALAKVFSAALPDAGLRHEIEGLITPSVVAAVEQWKAGLTRPGVLDAALLFELRLNAVCDATVCVRAPAHVRRAWVEARATASATLFDAIEQAQWTEV